MDSVSLAGLVQIELPGDTLRICDGGFLTWGADSFSSRADGFGSIASLSAPEEGIGDELAALQMVFLPESTAAAADLSQPQFQGAAVSFWTAEFNPATHVVTGTPKLEFEGQIDNCVLTIDRGTRELAIDIVPLAERLFLLNEGNTLSPRFHKLNYPGELGEDNATGVGIGVAWGTALPAQTYGGGFNYGGGGGGIRDLNSQEDLR